MLYPQTVVSGVRVCSVLRPAHGAHATPVQVRRGEYVSGANKAFTPRSGSDSESLEAVVILRA